MNNNILLKGIIAAVSLMMCACHSSPRKSPLPDTPKIAISKNLSRVENKDMQFENSIYLKIDEVHSGKVYTNSDGKDVFYRILEVPEEENTMLIAEKISIGEEGGNYQLVKRLRLNDLSSETPGHGFSRVDSVKFVDSVSVREYLKGKTIQLNLDSLK